MVSMYAALFLQAFEAANYLAHHFSLAQRSTAYTLLSTTGVASH